ncbi:60S ribosomal protein L7-1-like isoform X1 [Salvia miltiorrhiza]|uniref:60S ribosomal protein L7-1-like isoform X1 n=1 Tax=Salvia miltiorrhiza TaxID=226208 RepID=UPI0025AD8C11|nr:60S ribosomal protein L7-1-like isoform X1 [Salvia miltiorrhiza]
MAAEAAALNFIPEVVLKKRKTNEQWAIRRKLQQQERAKRLKTGTFIIKKPEQFIRENRDKELDLVQMKSRGKLIRAASFTLESNLLFVIRIQGKNDMHPKTRKILYSLRLRKIRTGVFVKASAGMMEMLQKVEPYVTYGYPDVKSVKDLIYKKGVVRVGKERIPLIDNNIVEQVRASSDSIFVIFQICPNMIICLLQELGKHNIICIEDIVNEVVSVGSHFKAVNSFLCPFVLNNPEKALQGKKKRFEDGGDSGNRKVQINELISKMN